MLQARMLEILKDEIAATGRTPSYEVLAHRLGLRAKSQAHRLVTALVKRGQILRAPHLQHGIDINPDAPEIVPDLVAPHPPAVRARTAEARQERTYVVELEGDLYQRLRQLAKKAKIPPEQIIGEALRWWIMEESGEPKERQAS